MNQPRLMFVNHVSTMSGAEYVLAQVAKAFPQASAFLFEHGPLEVALKAEGLRTIVSSHGGELGAIKRDQSLLKAVPAASKLARIVWAIAGAARAHDILYANSQKAFLLSALAVTGVRRPLIWHLHDILDGEHFGGAQRKVQINLANRLATRVIVPSTACGDAFVNAGGRDSLVVVVPNGVPVPARQPRPDRAGLGLPEGPLLGVFSRLAKWKGQHVVLETLRATPGVKAVFAGSALFGEDAYERELREKVREFGLEGRAIFLGQRSDVSTLMAAVDVVVHPSIYAEPFGLTLVEAMMAGTPVIATDAGAAREILDNGNAGTLIAPENAAALADALKTTFATLSSSGPNVDQAAKRALALYSSERMQQDISSLVQSLATRRAA